MADLSLSPALSSAAPAPAPAPPPSVNRPAVAPPKVETADPSEDKDTNGIPKGAAPANPKTTIASAVSSSGSLGGLIPELFSDSPDDVSSIISTGRALQTLPTITQVGALPTATESSIIDGLSHAANDCSTAGSSCGDALDKRVPIAISTISELLLRYVILRLRPVAAGLCFAISFFCWWKPRRERRLKSEV